MALSYIDNGIIKLGVELRWGAGVAHMSELSGPYAGQNVVDDNDQGRLIQQSYYGTSPNPYYDEEESIPVWDENWPCNPIQGGNAGDSPDNPPLELVNSSSTLYAKIKPREWGLVDQFSPGIMEEWISLQGKVATIRFKYVYDDTITHTFREQESPAFFLKRGLLKRFVSYDGNAPWTNGPLKAIFPGGADWSEPDNTSHILATEKWAAYTRSPDPTAPEMNWQTYALNEDAVGLYSPVAADEQLSSFEQDFDNWLCYQVDNTSYMAPQTFTALGPANSTYDYTFYVGIGSVQEVRKTFYNIRNEVGPLAVDNDKASGQYAVGTLIALAAADLRGFGASIQYRWNGGAWQNYSAPVELQTGTMEWQAYEGSTYGAMQSAEYTTEGVISVTAATADLSLFASVPTVTRTLLATAVPADLALTAGIPTVAAILSASNRIRAPGGEAIGVYCWDGVQHQPVTVTFQT